ncbi:S10 family peptidase [Algivirga pacifica]|uniref:Carboxypeptidase n=1 Tax=Algivirga pacifica TaxID=1162670 RepID=A0ABP9CXB0_9BACT
MIKQTLLLLLFIYSFLGAFAQSLHVPVDTAVVSHDQVVINGKTIKYQATTGTQPVWDKSGKPIATLYYTYYQKKDPAKKGKTDYADRPLVISFNGGPGSASVWMHIAYTGPKVLNIDEEGYPVQPYGVHDNEFSILDVADILYVNPVNTGYSRTLPIDGKEVQRDQFFGINADIKYLAEWVNTFVNRNNRWLSPKYLIGESYGGTRVAGLASELQERQWMYLNGVILVSPADYKAMESDAPISSAINFPYFTAAAWYHGQLPEALQQKDLLEVLPQAEAFAVNTLMPALTKGGFLPQEEKEAVAKKMAELSGISKEVILQYNLDVPTSFFWKELLRNKSGHTIGRLDSRYLGLDKTEGGVRPDFNAELNSWLHSFTPAINYYIKNHLGFRTDLKYNMFGPVHPWDRSNNNTRDNLRRAMAQNPYLKVLFQSGYYDGATTYFNAKYTMWQLDPSGKLKDRMDFKGYRSGHMMYLRKQDLKTANDDLREFILGSMPGSKAAKY